MSYLSGTEHALDVCVPLLEPFSLSKVPFLSNDFSVWEEQERKGRMIKCVFSELFTTIESQINIFFCPLETLSHRLARGIHTRITLKTALGIDILGQLTLIRKNPALSKHIF